MRTQEKQKYLDRAKKLTMDFMAQEPASIYLFGSWARGEENHGSDIDIAVDYQGKSNRRKIGDLSELLEESSLPYRVDVVDMQHAAGYIRAAVRKDGILWKKQPNG